MKDFVYFTKLRDSLISELNEGIKNMDANEHTKTVLLDSMDKIDATLTHIILRLFSE